MADRSRIRGFLREEHVTYASILLYITLSSGQIFFNKWVLSSKEINFPYPLGLTLLHMTFSSVLCFLLTKVFKVMKVEEGMTLEIYVTSVIPIGAMFAMTLWLGNTAYLYITVAFSQMLKAIMPVAVFILGVCVGLEIMSCKMLLIMSVISFGVLVSSYGELNINWVGVVYQMGGIVSEALRLILMEILVKRKGIKLNPLSLMYYMSPCSAICLFIPWIFLEKSKMDTWNFHVLVLSLNSLCTFALNLSVFLVISRTSALTIRIAGVVKDWLVVLVSALLFAETKLTIINLFGYAVAIVGVATYNNHKPKNGESITLVSQSPKNSDKKPDGPL
ncbi:Sugar phosphate transporter domain [Arabidopsis suecica]|uniref:Probable sugar phosphate/phosphate translocator At1g53660 n=6 Tax=Arabidopsis TaxID=3701 RepID=PT153_ARATH|nr:nodulin MtN21 /EamA-like transporter family protein [Arabidopsis thaliana]Q9C8M1.2 RecName: Full=Probable sugar phosphate/phosphate translocator At1g53660 [Arabidopsis thaliana]AEE32978.1 nodulin MtN21 /EamA-like transporter family protein [Arabidopsis thaliana]KAG7657400.1 Sugar phosphate transporter domain [Arabidopsis suecica]|eukprot:NP_175770.4 nodulin MtN21 /EamA-like transporter family protein [Arabidopsis thaliana]